MTVIKGKIGNAKYEVTESGAVLKSTDGYVLASISLRNEYVYCQIGKYNSDQILQKRLGSDDTYDVVNNPNRQSNRETRLQQVEKDLERLRDEVNCIRNND